MILLVLAVASLSLAMMSAALFAANLRQFRKLPAAPAGSTPFVSVLIPARDEERSIGPAIESVLANHGVELELIVVDDQSTDSTASVVREKARRDPRVKLESAPPLPPGWCGKQHACHVLSCLARHELLVWMDADVRLAPDALARIAAWMTAHPGVGLLSGFPRQETGTFLERLLIPLIHFILLGFLPLSKMRSTLHPAYGAGCGQLFIARRESYLQAGGHAAIRASLHDGIMLPRAFRKAGLLTDLFDATDLATCRMYHSAAGTWAGLAKNASEGMAGRKVIFFWTAILLVGQVVPAILLFALACTGLKAAVPYRSTMWVLCTTALLLSFVVRLAGALHFKQSRLSALLHPLGVTVLVIIQWQAFINGCLGRRAAWKGRDYTTRPM